MANFPELEQRFGGRDTCADCDPREQRSQEEWSFADGSESEQTLPSTYRLSVGRSLRFVYCAREPPFDRACAITWKTDSAAAKPIGV